MKLLVFVIFFGLHLIGFSQQLAMPTSNQPSGIYTNDITVNISHITPGVTIFYTVNGDTPTPSDNIYTGPITLSAISGVSNYNSMIPTNPSFNYPTGTYDLTRANNRGWLPPYNNVYKINVLRFRAYKAGFAPSETLTQTFMIDPAGANKYAFPVLSLVYDGKDLFSDETGIYVYGNHPDGNYSQKGVAWERVSHFELFDETGTLVISKNIRSRIHGGGSRSSCKKNIRLYGDSEPSANFNYPFFENYSLDKFKRILIRSGGHRPDCFPRDDLANMLTEGLSVDQQHARHIILFINGEYWGIHSIKERVDKYFIQNRYGVDDDEITILDQEYDVQDGYQVDSDEMASLEDYVMANDMSLDQHYQYASEKMDSDNYIDYMCSEIFLSNEDWVYSNVMIWRKTGAYDPSKPIGQDGKFRWIFYDFDGAFGGACNNAFYTVNTLNAATVVSGLYSSYSRLFRGLLDNPGFKIKFINRMCDLMNSQFRQSRMHAKMDEIYAKLTPEMMENVNRWRYPSTATTLYTRSTEVPSLTQWDLSFYYLHIFAERRQRKVRDHIMAKWGYPDSSLVTVNVNDPAMGMVQVNSILINENLPAVTASVYPWTGYYIDNVEVPLKAVAKPGYKFVEWMETSQITETILWNPSVDITYTAIFEEDLSYQPILINELMCSNTNYLFDNFNEADDWLELYNPNNYSVNLSGCKLEMNGTSWIIPNGTNIDANGYLIFWHDNQSYQGLNHTNFKLSNSVNTVYLKLSNGNTIDSLQYPNTSPNLSFGRYPNGSNTYNIFDYPTPEKNNNIAGTETSVKIDFSVYPNPSSSQFIFSKSRDFTLFDIHGKIVLKGSNTTQINLENFENGIYILKTGEGETIKLMLKK